MNINTNIGDTQTITKPRLPARTSRMQPIVAIRALQHLIRDPEQTEQVFVIIKAMSGNSHEKTFARFRSTEAGQKILREKRNLLSTLLNRQVLQEALGKVNHENDNEPCLGDMYLKFVESEKITADGLVEASRMEDVIEDPDSRLFAERMRDQHDLWHVTTGYGRDTFGEACLLAFTYAQTKNRGLGIIALVGMIKISKELGPDVKKAMWQAYKAGKRAAWLPTQDWEALLLQPIDEVRKQLNITAPIKYREVFNLYQLAHA